MPNKHHSNHKARKDIEEDSMSEQKGDVDIDAGLSAIYGEEREDLQTVARAPNRLTRFLVRVIIVLFVLCFASVLGFFVYETWFSQGSSAKPLTMTFVTPDDIQSGSETAIELQYRNETAYPLTAVEIDLNVPSGFVLVSSEPSVTDEQRIVWDLGTIPARSDGKIVVRGFWYADVPSTTGIQALVSYKPANFNASFHDILTKTISTTASTTLVTLDAPTTANVGETTTYTATISTESTATITAPNVVVTLPEGFFLSSTSPALEPGGSTTWTLPDLMTGTPQTIILTGAFASDVSGDRTLTVAVGISGDRFSPQATATAVTTVKPSALAVTVVGNGGTGSIFADPGSTLRLSVRIDNTSDQTIDSATALLDFTAEDNLPIVWATALLDGGKVTAKGIAFDAKTLGSLGSGAYTILNLSLPLKEDLAAVSSSFSLASSVTYGAVTVFGSPLIVALNSDADIATSLRYFDEDGAPLGSGPLPPTVGSTTHYRAVWMVSVGEHGLRDIRISATLPENISWDDFSTATSGSVTYDATTRVVSWAISSLPSGSGQVVARMSLGLTPIASDTGHEVTVLGKTMLSAKDDVTGTTIERSADAVTTACEDDPLIAGKGLVQ